jgi:hypothetical protein
MSEGGEKKKVFINPQIFNPDSFTRKKKPRPDKILKVKSDKHVSDKTRRNQILKKIRENQEKQYKSLFSNESDREPTKKSKETEQFESDFDKSISFMNQIVDSRPKSVVNTNNHTLKNTEFFKPANINPNPTQLNDIFSNPIQSQNQMQFMPKPVFQSPTYGCLKNGSLPTYKSLHNATAKNVGALAQPGGNFQGSSMNVDNNLIPINFNNSAGNDLLQPIGRIKSPDEMELMRKLHEQKKEAEKPKPKLVQKKIKKLLRRTFNVGKDRFRPRVGVLLPNRTIRNNVTTKSFMIKQKPISEIRKFLLNQGFIKVGSTAPTDVLRKMYESIAMIDGDVKNHNPDNLLYNFFKENDKH